jgi:hypothetical protein
MPAGRPKAVTEEVIRKLEEAFSWGCTDREACCYADIGSSTLYDYCQANPDFSERKEDLKNHPTMKARRIVKASLDDNDLTTANKVLDRKEGARKVLDITTGGKSLNRWTINPVTTDKDG